MPFVENKGTVFEGRKIDGRPSEALDQGNGHRAGPALARTNHTWFDSEIVADLLLRLPEQDCGGEDNHAHHAASGLRFGHR